MLSRRKAAARYQPVKTYYGNSQRVRGRGRGRVRIGTRTHYIEGIRAYQEVVMQKKPVVDISNKKGIDSAKLPKDQIFLKVCRIYHAILESWIRIYQLKSYRHVKDHRCW